MRPLTSSQASAPPSARAIPTSRPSASSTGPPAASGTSGAVEPQRRGAHARGQRQQALAGPRAAAAVDGHERPRLGAGPAPSASETSPGTRGCVSTSASSSHGARATIRP